VGIHDPVVSNFQMNLFSFSFSQFECMNADFVISFYTFVKRILYIHEL